MARPVINSDECSGCGSCVDVCPAEVLDIIRDKAVMVNEDNCVECGACMEECAMGAIDDGEEF